MLAYILLSIAFVTMFTSMFTNKFYEWLYPMSLVILLVGCGIGIYDASQDDIPQQPAESLAVTCEDGVYVTSSVPHNSIVTTSGSQVQC